MHLYASLHVYASFQENCSVSLKALRDAFDQCNLAEERRINIRTYKYKGNLIFEWFLRHAAVGLLHWRVRLTLSSSTGHKFERFWSEGVELGITTCKVTPTKTTLRPVLFVVAHRVPGFIVAGASLTSKDPTGDKDWAHQGMQKPPQNCTTFGCSWTSQRRCSRTIWTSVFWRHALVESVWILWVRSQLCWVSTGRVDSWTSLTWIFVSYGECKRIVTPGFPRHACHIHVCSKNTWN